MGDPHLYDTLLINEREARATFCGKEQVAIELVEAALRKRAAGDVLLPDKISQIFDPKIQNRINCLPATLVSDNLCGMKWVSVFPENPRHGIRNLTGLVILSELQHGLTLSVMDGTYLTGIRTAAVGAVAAKHLARADAATIGFIGAGREARMHLDMLRLVRPSLKKCYVSSRSTETVLSFIEEGSAKHPDMEFINCADHYRAAAKPADIIVTATSSQLQLLKAEYVQEGAFYVHVGGLEDEYEVPKKAQKIVCDEWESVKHRSQTISLMYKAGTLSDEDIYSDLGEIVTGAKPGRENDTEFIYFCSVGLSFIDVTFARYIYEEAKRLGLGTPYAFLT